MDVDGVAADRESTGQLVGCLAMHFECEEVHSEPAFFAALLGGEPLGFPLPMAFDCLELHEVAWLGGGDREATGHLPIAFD